MKVLKSLAVFAAVLALGACEIKPKDEAIDPAPFLDAVKGKSVVSDDQTGQEVDAGIFSADGKTFTDASSQKNVLTFQGADSDLVGKYKDPGEAIWTFTLNADKQSGVVKGGPQDINFKFK